MKLSETKLFTPINVGNITMAHRIAYAPCTRCRTSTDLTPTKDMLKYYEERSEHNGGLIVFEATAPIKDYGIFPPTSPVIETPDQIMAFKKIVDSIHEKGTFVSLQLWNVGRLSMTPGLPCKSPSKIYETKAKREMLNDLGIELEELTIEEIKQIPNVFASAAERAINEAGFDFIEIHSAYGNLLDEFLQNSVNHRTDEYGGSIENKARLVLEVLDECIKRVGGHRVGIRFTPYGYIASERYKGGTSIDQWKYLINEIENRKQLNGKGIAYISLVISGSVSKNRNIFDWVPKIWSGVLMISGDFLEKPYIGQLGDYITNHENTIIGIGKYFLSNPDLVDRLRNGYGLTPYNPDTFYSGGKKGYLGYPRYQQRDGLL